jgi:hypothetical protein
MAAAIAAASLTGCAGLVWPGTHAAAPVRPAASPPPGDDVELLLAPSLDLASPEDAVVRVVGPQMTCSGTLIAEDLVLTAHHCVVERRGHGEFTTKLVSPASLQVELGGDYLPWGNAGIKAVLAPPCGENGGRGDIAVLVLERKLVGIATISLRDAPPRVGQLVDPVGFGRCALSPPGIRRREREGATVGVVTKATFEVTASVCPGDSGGPALDRVTREVVGVVSLSAMDYDEATRGRAVFARIDGLPVVAAYARLVADGADPSDLPPLSCD